MICFQRKGTAFSLLCIAATLVLAACSSSSPNSDTDAGPASTFDTPTYSGPEANLPTSFPTPEKKSGTSFTIGWLIPNASVPSLQSLTTGIEKEAKRLGGEVIVLDSQLNPQTEVSNFNQLLAQNVSGIISFPLDPGALAPSLAKAKEQGVPVISIDAPPSASGALIEGYIANIQLTRDRAASALASYAASIAPGGEFAILGIAAPIPSLQYVSEQDKNWAEKAGMQYAGRIDSQADTNAGAAQALSSIIAKYPNVKVVFAYNDVSAVGAAAQARSVAPDVKVLGFNGEDAAVSSVKSGMLAATYSIPYVQNGVEAVDALYDTITKQHLPLAARISAPGTLVTR